MLEQFEDPAFWVLLAFIVFLALAGRKGISALTGALDKRAEDIRRKIDEAEKLKLDAEQQLVTYQRRLREAEKEAEDIVAEARAEAARLRDQAAKELQEALQRREKLALDKIAVAEQKAVEDVRRIAADVAIAATARTLEAGLNKSRANALVDEAIDGIGRTH